MKDILFPTGILTITRKAVGSSYNKAAALPVSLLVPSTTPQTLTG